MSDAEDSRTTLPLAGRATEVFGSGPVRPPGSAPALPSRRTFGRYVLLSELGRGGMAVVYAAYHPDLDRKVALKLLHPTGESSDELARARLLREAQAMAKLAHPNVVQVFDVGSVDGEVFVAMEMVEGETLAERLARGRVAWREAVVIFLAAGRGLAAAHGAGIAHRDFKPANVLLGKDGRVRVLDFGIARPLVELRAESDRSGESVRHAELARESLLFDSQLTRVGTILGTPQYLAPELVRGGEADARSDQFAYCVALFETLFGRLPFAGSSLLELTKSAEAGGLRLPREGGVPAWLGRVISRGLSARRDDRFPSLDALLEQLERGRGARRRRRLAGAVLLLAASLAAAMMIPRAWSPRACDPAGRFAGIWEGAQKRELERGFLATGLPWAPAAWSGLERRLDSYVEQWSASFRDACEATRVRAEQSAEHLDLRMACLEVRRKNVRALVSEILAGDADTLARAPAAAGELPGLAACADRVGLAATLPRPADEGRRRSLEELESELARANGQRLTGRYDEGLELARRAATSAAALAYAPTLAEALRSRALLEDATGDSVAAERTLFEAIAAATEGRHDRLAAEAWTDLVMVSGWRQRRYDEGRRWAEIARAGIARLGGDAILLADLETHLSTVEVGAGAPARGLELALSALSRYEDHLGEDHPSIGRVLSRIGSALLEAGRPEEARDFYQRALDHGIRVLGPQHPFVATRMGNLALVLEDLGRLDDAITMTKRAMVIERQTRGEEHPDVAVSHSNLGLLYQRAGRYEEALRQQREALRISEKALAPDHPDLGISVLNVGTALGKLGRHAEALAAHLRALAILERALGANHAWVGVAHRNVGADLQNLGRTAEALVQLETALRVLEAQGTSESLPGTRFDLAQVLWKLGEDRARALELAELAHQALLTAGPRHGELRADVEQWLAQRGPRRAKRDGR